MKKHLSTIILVLVFFMGLSVLLYPTVSNWWNSRVQTRAIASYDAALQEMDEKDYTALFEQADAYNAALRELSSPLTSYDEVAGYEDILDITGTGIMGYITIPRIEVELPIYHGTDEGVLQVAAGHLKGTSLPVGGAGTHCVISAHRGLPSAKLFTDLDELEVGDTFTITVLDRLLTYEVDQIHIVLPEETEELEIVDGKDYVTLLTCTPYGINTHRLLVRGHRVDNADTTVIHVTNEAYELDPMTFAPIIAVPILLVLLIVLLVKYRSKDKKDEKTGKTDKKK